MVDAIYYHFGASQKLTQQAMKDNCEKEFKTLNALQSNPNVLKLKAVSICCL
jgi:hypothetical protein